MQTLEAQLFVVTFVLALLIIIIFLYKVMLKALGGPDKKDKKPKEKMKIAPAQGGAVAKPRRPVIRRDESPEEGVPHA